MLSMTRSLVAAQRDASRRVTEARKFSIRLPLIGAVRVPPPDQLAFYAVLGGLAVLELIDWPVAAGDGHRVGRRVPAPDRPGEARGRAGGGHRRLAARARPRRRRRRRHQPRRLRRRRPP